MSADPQAALVCLLDNDWHKFGLHRAVDLDLHIAEIGVVVDPLARLFGSRCQHLDRALIWAGTVDESGKHHARPNLLALSMCFAELPRSSMELPMSRTW